MAVGAVVGFAVGLAVGAVVGFAVGLAVAVGFAVGAVVGLAVGLAVAVGFAVGAVVGLAVGAVVGLAVAVGFGVAVVEGFVVALLPEDGLLVVLPELGFVVAEGFAVALGFDVVLLEELEDDGLLVVLLSVLEDADELLSFELSVLLLSVFAFGVAVGFALAVLELAVGLLLAADALLSCSFSDTELLTALDSVVSGAASLTPPETAAPQPAAHTISAAASTAAAIFVFM